MIEAGIIRQALAKIRDHGANYVYFFQKLNSPDWIEPLWKAGFFKNPPVPEQQGDAIMFLPWVESQYLVRMADKSPEIIVKIVHAMADTDNPRVHQDILNLAIKLPPKLAAEIVPRIISMLQKTNGIFIHTQIVQVINHLAKGGQASSALSIARFALEFLPDRIKGEKRTNKREAPEIFSHRLEPLPRWQTHDFKDILENGMGFLSKEDPLAVFELTCEILNNAIKLSIRADEQTKQDGEDLSIGWRPAIENHDQNYDFSHKQLLVPVIRDSASQYLQLHADNFVIIEQTLSQFRWDVFKRVYIHLCRVFPQAAGIERIKNVLLDEKFFDNYRFKHEWSLLLSEQFKNLSEDEKNVILNWVETKFKSEGRIEHFKREWKKDPSEEEVQSWKNYWQRDHLFFIAADLQGDWKKRYEHIITKIGEPEHPSFPLWSSGVMSGHKSPKSAEQLLIMSVKDILSYLKEWKMAGGHPFGESFEGLAAAFEFAVKSEPTKFNTAIVEFKNLRPDYVKAAIRGFSQAAADGKEINWKSLLELCDWVLQQNQGSELLTEGEPIVDKHWRWARMEIVRFISDSLKRDKGQLPFQFREIVWSILKILVEDAIPDLDYEKKYANGKQYGTLSINTTRGEAMHALFNYAEWVRKQTSAPEKVDPAIEILEPLTSHLDLKVDPTFTIRSVYCQHLGWLYYYHEDWLKSNLEKIFPKAKELEAYREAAWQTYVTYARPWMPLFNLLKDEYERAVTNVSQHTGKNNEYDLQHPNNSLSQHLITLYWWGVLSIDEPNSLISRFFNKAPDVVRSYAIDFAGRAIWNSKDDVPKEILERLQHLFDTRLKAAKENRPRKEFMRELSAFEPWVYSLKFDGLWTLRTLEEVLILTKNDKQHKGYILEPLSKLSERYPLEAVKCLKILIESTAKQFGWYGDPAKVKKILRDAIGRNEGVAKQIAVEVKDYLLKQGLFEFRNLDEPEKIES